MLLPFRILLITAIIFALLRCTFFVYYFHYFSNTSLIHALISGSRYDLKLAVIAMSPWLLLMLLPLPTKPAIIIRKLSAWLCCVTLFILMGLSLANLAYFGEVNRHITYELIQIISDSNLLVQTALSSRLTSTLISISILIGIIYLWKKWVIPSAISYTPPTLYKQITINSLSLICLIFLARGMVLSGKPLTTIDAFNHHAGQAQANLTLNGTLITIESILKQKNSQPIRYLSAKEIQQVSQLDLPQSFTYFPQPISAQRNVIIILLESWSYQYIDALAGTHYGVTPYMDTLIKQSQVWDNFYAAGQRSIIGIQATLTSIPILPNHPNLGFGLELNEIPRIGSLAQQQGYRTLMLQTSNKRSFHLDGIAQSLGFQEYYGKEDIPLIRNYPQKTPPFGWDYDSLMFLAHKLNQSHQPFFAFLFTGSTHEPFANAGKEFLIYPHDSKNENGFLNTLKYSDWSIQEFMNHAKQQPWYHNTIFIFTADHTAGIGNSASHPKANFHIPLIIFDPQNPQAKRHHQLASQYDLLPTIADLLGIKQPITTFGQSLINPQHTLPIMLNKGHITIIVQPNGEIAEFHDTQLISGNKNANVLWLQWRMQYADELLRKNQWFSLETKNRDKQPSRVKIINQNIRLPETNKLNHLSP